MDQSTKKLPEATEKKADKSQDKNADKPLDKEIHDLLGPFLEEKGITDAIVIVAAPKTKDAVIYYKGHFYDVAKLISHTHRKFKSKIVNEIDA